MNLTDRFIKSGSTSWDELRNLRDYLKGKRDQWLYIFSANHIDNKDMMEAFHDSYLDGLGRQANLEEKAANVHYRGYRHGKT